jgi:hypothetical protein
MPASIAFVRHAEKQPGDGPPHGVLVDGTPDPDSLIPRGWQRAGALVGLFVPRSIESLGQRCCRRPAACSHRKSVRTATADGHSKR